MSLKKLLIFLISLAVFTVAVEFNQLVEYEYYDDVIFHESRIYEAKIKEMIYNLMEDLRNKGLDPISGDYNISLTNLGIKKLNVKDIDVRGQTYFDIPTLTLSLAGLKFTYRLVWENIHVAANYDLEGDVADLHVFGNGDVLLNLNGFAIHGDGKLGSDENKFIFLEKFGIYFDLDPSSTQFKITGFMNNDTISEMFTNKLIEQLYLIEEQFGDSISWEVGKIVIKLFHDNVVNKTLSDIINGNFP